jgi:uncharacterized protein (TIGR03067 family)
MVLRATTAALTMIVFCTACALARDAKDEEKKLDGAWAPVSGEQGGEKFPDEVLKMIKVVFKDGGWTVTVGDATDKGIVSVDPSKKPKTMDIVCTEGRNKDKRFPAIYELTDDTLKVAYSLDGKERPKDFKSREGTMDLVMTYKRQKQ